MAENAVTVNRAPVLTLWAAVVAERLGHDADAALSLGKAVAGLNAQAKGRRLGIFKSPDDEPASKDRTADRKPSKKSGLGEEFWIDLCGRAVPAIKTADGVRAVVKDKPIDSDQVTAYLDRSFGEHLPAVRRAMAQLAGAFPPKALADLAFRLYEQFRPQVAPGQRGWGQKGTLDLQRIRALAKRSPRNQD